MPSSEGRAAARPQANLNPSGAGRITAEQWRYPANLLSELRLLTAPAIVTAVALRHYGWGLGLFVAAAVSDGLDGWLARRLRQNSALGSVLDPMADKLLLNAVFVALAIVGALPWALGILVITRDLCIVAAALVLVRETQFRDFRPTWWGKASTTAELATVAFALLEAAAPSRFAWVMVRIGWFAVSGFAVVSGIHYAFTAAARYHAQRLRA